MLGYLSRVLYDILPYGQVQVQNGGFSIKIICQIEFLRDISDLHVHVPFVQNMDYLY